MTEKIRFHLDENVSNAIAEGLRRRIIDVTTTPEVGFWLLQATSLRLQCCLAFAPTLRERLLLTETLRERRMRETKKTWFIY